jgi:polyadenylate-binding protein
MSAAAGYEEEEPFEVEFYDDELDVEQCNGTALPENKDPSDEEPFEVDLCSDKGSGKADSSHSEHYINLVPDGHNTCRNQLYVVEPCHGLMTDKEEFVEKKSNYVQPSKQEQNKKELCRGVEAQQLCTEGGFCGQRKGNNAIQKTIICQVCC